MTDRRNGLRPGVRVIVSAGHEHIGQITAEKIGQASADRLRGGTGALGREAEWTAPWADALCGKLAALGIEALRVDALYHPEVYGQDADLLLVGHCDGVAGNGHPQWCMAGAIVSGGSSEGADTRAWAFCALWDEVYPRLIGIPADGPITDDMTGYYGGWYRTAATPAVLIEHGILGDATGWRADLPSPERAATADAAVVAQFFDIPQSDGEAAQAQPHDSLDSAIEANGRRIVLGFGSYYRELTAPGRQLQLRAVGLPLTNELSFRFSDNPNQPYQVQLFERAGFQYERGNLPPWDLHHLTVPYLIELYLHALAAGLIADSRTPLLRQWLLLTDPD